ncbi:MAG: hypothetical protein J7K21_01920 [Desulfurococcales archaeon]|nr:hypothetical protein [Desulfurococcales archaeon]
MSSRVIGRGKCSKCGREGSVVLKEVSGRIYVYIKHGREWCYLGPLERVDLSSIIISVRDYHTFTTKLAKYLRVKLGDVNMKVSTPFIIGLALLLAAYGIGLGGPGYSNYVLAMILLSTISFLLSIAVYESTYAKLQGYSMLSRILSKGLKLYIPLTIVLTIIVIIITIPLKTPLKFEFTCPIPSYVKAHEVEVTIEEPGILPGSRVSIGPVHSVTGVETYAFIYMAIPISSIIIASLLITYLSRPLVNSLKRFITYITISTLASYLILFTLPLIVHAVSEDISIFMEATVVNYIVISTAMASATTIAFIIIFIVLIAVLKNVIRM